MRLLCVYEFSESPDEWLFPDLVRVIQQRSRCLQIKWFNGFFQRYQAGGLRFERLLNCLGMHFLLPFKLLWNRPHVVLVRTSPPGLHLAVACYAKIFGINTICWMMDNHPQIEIRWLKGRGVPCLPQLLDFIDRKLIRTFDLIITLDKAMEQICHRQAPLTPIIIHPTWPPETQKGPQNATRAVGWQRYSANPEAPPPLRLLYAGNLGKAHPLPYLEILLRSLAPLEVQLHYVGNDVIARQDLEQRVRSIGGRFHYSPRFDHLEGLGDYIAEHQIDYGLVLFDEKLAGLLSPSKASGYLALSLPLLYVGPEGTTAHTICKIHKAGYAFTTDAIRDMEPSALAQMFGFEQRMQHRENAESACEIFSRKNADSLADSIFAQGWFQAD